MTTRTTPNVSNILFTDRMVRAMLDGTKDQTRRPKNRYGGPGDYVYVRENCRAKELNEKEAEQLRLDPHVDGVEYSADRKFIPIKPTTTAADDWLEMNYYGVKRGHSGRRGRMVPNIHMPRWASRLTLQLVDVRPEALLDITEHDARREGVSGRDEYLQLWDHLHGPGAARKNPTIYVLSFLLHRVQVDELLQMPRHHTTHDKSGAPL